jgi:hypothetical protein
MRTENPNEKSDQKAISKEEGREFAPPKSEQRPIPANFNLNNSENDQKEQIFNNTSDEDELVLQVSASEEATRVEEKQPSIKELLFKTAESMKQAFPSYGELTVGDITIGLASVAVEHKKQGILQKLYKQPCLFQIDQTDYDFATYKPNVSTRLNPEGIHVNKFILADKLLNYANFVYYPIVEPTVEEPAKVPIADKSLKQHYVLMGELQGNKDEITGESITKKKEHANVKAHLVENLLQFRCESGHLQNAFFTKLDFHLNALIISVRGTDSGMDVFTNFTANPTPLKAHRYYRNPDEEHYLSEEMVEGVVHKGKLDAARWVLSQNDAILHELFFKQENGNKDNNSEYEEKKRKIDRIYCVGHSLGGAVATLTGLLLREYMLEHRSKLRSTKLPLIHVVTYAPSAFISYPLSRWCRQFVDSFVIGSDIVPRMSVGQAERLRLEINESNWQVKVEQYLKEHSTISAMIGRFNKLLTSKGYNPLLDVNLPSEEEKSTSSTDIKETVTTTSEGDTKVEEVIKATTVTEDDIISTEKKISYDIETLYPPGNLYLFIEEEQEDEKEKDFASMLFKFMEKKLSDGTEATVEQSDEITATSLIRSWWNNTPTEKEKKKTVVKAIGHSAVVSVEHKRRKFIVRHVDAKHFDRIILSPSMFRDHRLVNYYDALTYMEEEFGIKEKNIPQVQTMRIAPLPTSNTTLVHKV